MTYTTVDQCLSVLLRAYTAQHGGRPGGLVKSSTSLEMPKNEAEQVKNLELNDLLPYGFVRPELR